MLTWEPDLGMDVVSERAIVGRASALRRVGEDVLAGVLCFGEVRVDADRVGEQDLTIGVSELLLNGVVHRLRSAVVAGAEHPQDVESWVQAVADGGHGSREGMYALNRHRGRVAGDQDPISGDKGVEGEVAGGGWAVDDDDVVMRARGLEGVAEEGLFADSCAQEVLGLLKRGIDRRDVQAVDLGGHGDVHDFEGTVFGEHDADASPSRGDEVSQRGLDTVLRVEVEQEDAPRVKPGKRRGEVDCGCGLADPSLERGDGHDAAVSVSERTSPVLSDKSA